MSLIVTVFVPTGIVMSGDSRTTIVLRPPAPVTPAAALDALGAQPPPAPPVQVETPLVLSDATYKVFILHGCFGVSTCGAALIEGMPIAHHIEKFEQSAATAPVNPQALATSLLAYFQSKTPVPHIWFHVAGYDADEPWVTFVDVPNNTTARWNRGGPNISYGARWNGDFEIAGRLASVATAKFAFDGLNIQGAVDFSRHIIRTTIDQMRFELNFPTVGGPIDTLLITPKTNKFLSRKEISCR